MIIDEHNGSKESNENDESKVRRGEELEAEEARRRAALGREMKVLREREGKEQRSAIHRSVR